MFTIGSKFVIQINGAKLVFEIRSHLLFKKSIVYYMFPLYFSKSYSASSLSKSAPSIIYSISFISLAYDFSN